jgi:hypothetical protein
VRPPKVVARKMVVLGWGQSVAVAEAHADR